MHLNARYYDPRLGLFIQADWFEMTKQSVGINRYAYSFNDPVNLHDPNGDFVPILLGELVFADWALVTYDQYQAFSDWQEGELTDGQFAKRTAMKAGGTLLPFDSITKLGGKGVKAVLNHGADVRIVTEDAAGIVAQKSNDMMDHPTRVLSQAETSKFNHIFGKPEHDLDVLVERFGSLEKAYLALDAVAQKAFKDNKITINAQGVSK